MSKQTESFYFSIAWQRCREAYGKSKHNLCERCAAKGIITPGEIVHHKVPVTPRNMTDPSITVNWDNLQLLCRKCHAEVHGQKTRRYIIGEDGHVTAV